MRILVLLLAFLMSAIQVQAKTITAAQDVWPPFVLDGKSQNGISVDIVIEAMATQGYQVEFKSMSWSRALNEVKAGKIDLLPATWFTQERTAFLRYSNSYLENKLKFIKKAGDGFEYAGLDSLTGKKVGIVRDYGYGGEFMSAKNFKKPAANDLLTNLKKLKAGRLDLTLEDELVAKSIIADSGLGLSNFAFTTDSMSVNKLHVTSGVANPQADELIAAFNKGLDTIKQNGKFAEILAKYGVK